VELEGSLPSLQEPPPPPTCRYPGPFKESEAVAIQIYSNSIMYCMCNTHGFNSVNRNSSCNNTVSCYGIQNLLILAPITEVILDLTVSAQNGCSLGEIGVLRTVPAYCCLVGRKAMQSGRSVPTFQKIYLPPSSGVLIMEAAGS
jgi:hypothetical protein